MPPSYQQSSGQSLSEEAAPTGNITGAVVDLYNARVEPRCKLIQWKVFQKFGSTYSVSLIRDVADKTPWLLLDPPDAKGAKRIFSVLLQVPPEGFQGFQDGKLDLPDEEIGQFEELLLEGGWELSIAADHQAFEIADWLCKSSNRPENFAQALAFVRSALNNHLLGTKNGRLVRFRESEEYLRRCNMERKLPTGVEKGEWYVATQASLRGCLKRLLRDQRGWLHVSEIKKMIRENFGAELSETAFGFGNLSQLLSAEFMQKDFVLEKVGEGNGDTYLCFRRRNVYEHWGHWSDPSCRIDRLQAGMKKLRDVPTIPTAPSGTLMSLLASQPLKGNAPAMASAASAASTAPSSPAYVKPHGQLLHGDALKARVLFSRKADQVKDEAKEISEPRKIEDISMVLDSTDSERVSGQRAVGQTKEPTVSKNRRGKKGKRRGEETQPSTASLLPPKQHPAIPELQEDPTESKATGVADVQTVSTNRRAKTNKKGGEETQPSAASVVDAGQHSSRPELQEDPKESNTSGAVDVHTVSTNHGSAEIGKKELEETSQSDPASDFAPQNPERTQRGKETVPIQAIPCAKASLHGIHLPSDGSRNVEPVELDDQENLEPAFPWLLPEFTLPSWCSIQRTFIQCVDTNSARLPARPQSTPARSEHPHDSPVEQLEPPTSCVMEDV